LRTFVIARVLCLGAVLCSTAQWATAQFGFPHDPKDDKPAPFKRTSDGKPDLDGLWLADTLAPFDVEDHEAVYGIPAGKGVVVDPADHKIPYQAFAFAKRAELFKDASNDPQAHCHLPGVPRAVYTPFPWQVIQKPGVVAFLYEYPHGIRIIHTDGSHQHPKGRDVLNTWMGDSVGHWEGDTLVVDVNGFNDQTWLDMAANFHSDQLHVVERYTMINPKNIQYEATLDDPKVYTKPWTMKFTIRAQPAGAEIMEFECNEGERDLQHYVK
jgi:hypothetical protein